MAVLFKKNEGYERENEKEGEKFKIFMPKRGVRIIWGCSRFPENGL